MSTTAAELRFAFGRNWQQLAAGLDEGRVAEAERSLRTMLGVSTLAGRTFLDVGCGSGLFSLAARRLGARVRSFDYDADSVRCAEMLRVRFAPGDADWAVEQGSALDRDYLERLGVFDVVYAWGVLHHTGDMWRALDLVAERVAPGGRLFLAVYNDQGAASRQWASVKRLYNRRPLFGRPALLAAALIWLWGPRTAIDLLAGRPFHTWRTYAAQRGMSPWRDVVDWVGGYPFEVATPEAVFDFHRARGFVLERLKTCGGGLGCNEFVFRRVQGGAA